ncbi:MAG: insulinase family protein [Acidobacteria bacterium]|nr:insulinase family protein [Acidobacteriota bacterium]MDW7983665.1 pitrilysin family protein [Acidobacteriota bacterium]
MRLHWLEPLRVEQLANGLRVLLLPDRTYPVGALVVYYGVGARDERPGETGFAHLFEHMMFQASTHVGKNEFFRHIESHGGTFNGNTTHDRTVYYEVLPASQLPLALWLESDRMRGLAVTQEHLDNQRDTVKEERRFRYDNQPYMQAWIRFGEMAYRNFANAHPVIGYYEDLDQASLESVYDFFRRYYRPNRAVLVVAGDLDPETALAWIRYYFEDIEPGPEVPPPDLTEPEPPVGMRDRWIDSNARFPALWVGGRIPPWGHPDFYALWLLHYVLFEGRASRLYRTWVQERARCLEFYSIWDGRRGPGTMSGLIIVPSDADPETWPDRFHTEVLAPPVSDEELERARALWVRRQWTRWQEVLERALDVGEAALLDGDPRAVERDAVGITAVRRSDVERVRETYLAPDRAIVLWIEPGCQSASSRGGAFR